ncbi:hypothetical protein, variant [Aphanomyces astaci]|uniref:Uncharacterized protein n=1 Tax=Aphanomyces astaci TaxID=112090 RepID=W4GX56_APHAT|nr:hypothetical protein, variant [Aphanomyces astaci]ETV83574.1 hypothetical protein, variant [Aphanomyces astaci]|eukprot:XP_009827004.1 hypothetical protein, variant [Aphanomyces astaci]
MSADAKWNWKEIIKQDKVERPSSLSLSSSAVVGGTPQGGGIAVPKPFYSQVPHRPKKAKAAYQATGITAEQKRAASLAQYGVGPSRDGVGPSRDAVGAIRNVFIAQLADDEPLLPLRKKADIFRIYTPDKSTETSTVTNVEDPLVVEEFSGLRIRDRKVPADVMREQMDGRTFIKLAKLETSRRQDLENSQLDWVTIGVLAKSTLSKAASGNAFVAWMLSDLENAMATLFLNNDAYSCHWKEMEGSVVAVLNPSIRPANEAGKFALSVSAGDNIVKLGTAMDFGMCRSLTHGGRQCNIPINVTHGDYCVVHVAAKFKAAGKGRQELNGAGTFRADLFQHGDSVRNVSAGTYAPKQPKRVPAKRKRPSEVFMAPPTITTTQVDAMGGVVVVVPAAAAATPSQRQTSTSTAPDFVRRADPSGSLEQLRQVIQGGKEGHKAGSSGPNNSTSKNALIAKILGVGTGVKKVNMMNLVMKQTGTSSALPPPPPPQALKPLNSSTTHGMTRPLSTANATAAATLNRRRPSPRSNDALANVKRVAPPSSNRRASQVTSLRASGMLPE